MSLLPLAQLCAECVGNLERAEALLTLGKPALARTQLRATFITANFCLGNHDGDKEVCRWLVDILSAAVELDTECVLAMGGAA